MGAESSLSHLYPLPTYTTPLSPFKVICCRLFFSHIFWVLLLLPWSVWHVYDLSSLKRRLCSCEMSELLMADHILWAKSCLETIIIIIIITGNTTNRIGIYEHNYLIILLVHFIQYTQCGQEWFQNE